MRGCFRYAGSMGAAPRNILVVDDDATFTRALTRDLRNHVVFTARNALDAVSALNSERIDLALIDYRLSDDNGLAIIREAKCHRPDLPCFLYSAYLTPSLGFLAAQSGADGVIPKWIRPRNALSDIERITTLGSAGQPTLTDVQNGYILHILNCNNWNISKSARLLGIHRYSLQRILTRMGIGKVEHKD